MTRKLSVHCKASTLALAVALVAGPSPAAAQSFEGTVNSQVGASVDQSVPGQTTVTVNQEQAVIDWTATNAPSGGTIIFQQDGTSATFVGASNFAVLNRVFPGSAGNAIYMGGSINSLIGENVGGTVFFYSPNGIIIGQNASINVGSLGLTTLPIADDGSPDAIWMQGFGTANPQVTFGTATDSNSFIRTNPVIDGSINAFGAGAYVALVAPVIEHSGLIRTDHAAALVASEAAVITFSPSGLYDIQVTVGTDSGERLTVDGGTITRNPNTPEGTHHQAYLVSVAKNDAVTMVIENGGSIGFETATSVQMGEDNIVILTSGDMTDGLPTVSNTDNRVDLSIDSSTFSSNVFANISGSADIRTSTGDTDFGRNLTLLASENSIITAVNGNLLSIGGDLVVGMDEIGPGADTVGSLFRLSATGGSDLTVGGDVWLSSQVTGSPEGGSGVDAADVTGGTVIVQTGTGSTIDIAGSLNIDVDAIGGDHGGSDGAAGAATGGNAQILAQGGNSLISVGGAVIVTADASGGNQEECSVCDITGGDATGGNILIEASIGANNQLDLNSSVTLSATAEGGAGDFVGGAAHGGNVQLNSRDGGSVGITSFLLVDTWAFGGFGSDDLDDGTLGGAATGGNISMAFSGAASTIDLDGGANFNAYSGGGDGGVGGDATGGVILLQLGSNGTLTSPTLFGTVNASGGSGDVGGDGTGGQNWIQALGGAVLNLGDVELDAIGFGGQGNVGAGGIGTGGNILVGANSATLNITGDLDLDASGWGGRTGGDIAPGGTGQGGQAEIAASGGGTVNLDGLVDAIANGYGGGSDLLTAQSGDGRGGNVIFQAFGGGSLDAAFDVFLSADGHGGTVGNDCSECGGAGGSGFGGDVRVDAKGTADPAIFVGGDLQLTAQGFGAEGYGGAAGNGTGGIARVLLNNTGSMAVTGGLAVNATGWGAGHSNGGTGGTGTGGTAAIYSNGGSLDVSGDTFLEANGYGGSSEIGIGSNGGNGVGGLAEIYSPGGSLNFFNLSLKAIGQGGDSVGAVGGNAAGGISRVTSDGAAIHVLNDLSMDGGAIGGDGDTGGNATANVSIPEDQPIAVGIYTVAGGSITVDGDTGLSAQSAGGNGADGNGGNANAGEVDVIAFFGNINLAALSVGVSAYGGSGGNGGNGGNGLAGHVDVTFGLGAAAVGGSITLDSAFILADGFGGAGGDGESGTGGNGGAGGIGRGGNVILAGSANGGTLVTGAATITARGEGGVGGDGGDGGSGTGGDGGVGGLGRGGFIQTGTLSAELSSTSGGGATYTTLSGNTSGFGGDGGNGGLGGAGDGAGGNGGEAIGGQSTFLVRGVLVTADTVQLFAGATGGDGGAGSVQGNGGNATSGAIRVESKDRFGHPTERGSLIADSITGTAFTVGGDGAIDGTSTVLGNSYFRVLNGDADVNLVSIQTTGDIFSPVQGPSRVSVRDGTALIDSFSFITTGQLTLDGGKQTVGSLFDGLMVSNSITLTAATFVPDTEPAPAVPGTYQAGTFNITTGDDFITNANLISGSDLTIDAPGDIDMANIVATDFVDLHAGGNIDTGTIGAGDNITVIADSGAITGGSMNSGGAILLDGATGVSTGVLGNLTAAGGIQVLSGGSILTGIATSNGGDILMDGDGSVSVESVNASGSATLLAGTNFNTGNINAGGPVTITALTGTMDIGNMIAGGNVSLTAGDTILGEDITTPGSITASTGTGLLRLEILQSGGNVDLSAGGDLTTASVDAFGFVSMLAGGDILFGDISAFVVDIDAGGSIEGGNIDSDTDITALAGADIDLLDLFAGGITIEGFTEGNVDLTAGGGINTGAIDAVGSVFADAVGAIDTGAIDALTFVQLLAGGNILTGAINAGGNIDIFSTGGDILTGNLTGADIDLESETGDVEFGDVDANLFDFDAGGAANGGNIVATSAATGSADGAVVLGNVNVSGVPPVDEFSVGFSSGTSIEVGDVFGADKVGFATFGSLVTGDLQAGNLIMALVGGDITVGSMETTNPGGQIYMADSQMYVDAGGLDDEFDLNLVLQNDPIPTGGSVTINGPVDTDLLTIAASGLITFNDDVAADGSTLMSGDLALANGVTVSGFTSLYSINGQGTFVGDGLAGPGYMLSNAEYNAFQNVGMEVRTDLGAAPLLFMGDLSINSSISEAAFAIEDADDNDLGTIRVVGDVRMNNANGELFFESETFQLDAATGSIVISADGTTPGGELIIAANNIHVAEGSILDQLADDPQYDGYQDDLNAPASVQRPDGVIRAATVTIEFGDTPADLYTLYVQNMGTDEVPAGFVITDMNLGDDGESTLPAGSVDLIINGQIITGTGTLTGIDVRDLLVEGRDLAPFTENSTINGCLLVGDCSDVVEPPVEPPVPPDFQPSPGIQQEVVLAKDNLLPPPEFGNEDFIDDNDEETDEGSTSPIAPPDPLFDTSELGEEAAAGDPEVGTPMRSHPGLTEPGDVNDPVSGSGNPALMETPAGPPSNEEKQQ